MTGSSEKANHYIGLLDAARVNASWAELPELVRKVNKHAPQRTVLTHTAAAEYEVATGSSTSVGRPTTSQASQVGSLAALSSVLQTEGQQDVEAAFQGRTCLLWSRWLSLEKSSATVGFDVAAEVRGLQGKSINTWTRICIVKSAYIEGTHYLRNGRPAEAQRVFDVALSNIKSNQELVLATPQLAYWAEQLLAQLAVGAQRDTGARTLDARQIEAFKQWGTIAAKTREVSSSTYKNSSLHLSRSSIWKMYYAHLSAVLAAEEANQRLPDTASRLQQATELRKVERAYENELLRTIKFPTATETNEMVEQWVEQAIRNWQILCGPQWQDTDLGEGGRNAYARNMLDILYRAASKTFQSTLILRRLFQVHLSLSEFDLAYRAFDTYIELVDRDRVRAAKSKQQGPGHESDEAVLSTTSEAVIALCKFGRLTEARKARELCLRLESWLESLGIGISNIDNDDGLSNGQVNGAGTHATIDPELLQLVYRAMGTGKANWARWTPESEVRSNLQQDALTTLRQACSLGHPTIETLYVTSLVLAETRDIEGAIQTTKQALGSRTSATASSFGWGLERKLVSVWHLLALLLSSRQDFDSATKGCLAAFEQFVPGDIEVGAGRNNSVSSNIEKQFSSTVSGFAADMETDELQRIIEVRITELALIELMDGPGEAVNCSNELLSLYSRLFSHLQLSLDANGSKGTLVAPKGSVSTPKGARDSMFGRSKAETKTDLFKEKHEETASTVASTTRPSTQATQAPTIQVTNEDEKRSKKNYIRRSLESAHSKITSDGGSKRLSLRHGHRAHEETHSQVTASHQSPELSEKPGHDSEPPAPIIPLEYNQSTAAKQAKPEVDHNLGSHATVPLPASHNEQPPQQDTRLPTLNRYTNATSPPPRFPKPVAQRQALTILAKVWLIIATLYRRANMFEDSKEACEEAGKAAARIETIVGAVDHSARAFAEAGWGAGAKSADEVWADVYCERAELQLAVYIHKVNEDETVTNEELRTAVDNYEQCLMFVPNHSSGIIGLSNILLDSFERKVDLGRRVNGGRLQVAEQEHQATLPPPPPTILISSDLNPEDPTVIPPDHPSPHPFKPVDDDLKKSPENLNRIAARDRAYGLLDTLTKLGSGWDDSEAWSALARAHELGGEVEKAKSILWWCIELEDSKPIRHWRNLGYVL